MLIRGIAVVSASRRHLPLRSCWYWPPAENHSDLVQFEIPGWAQLGLCIASQRMPLAALNR